MRERGEPSSSSGSRPRPPERGGDVDDVNVGEFLRQFREREIGAAEAVAMATKAAFGEAQGWTVGSGRLSIRIGAGLRARRFASSRRASAT